MANSGSTPVHQSQYVGYRVFIHRLNLDGFTVNSPYGGTMPLSSVLKTDFSDYNYNKLSDFFNQQHNFQALLKSLKDAIDSGLGAGPAMLSSGKGLLQTIDISPLIMNYTVELSIDAENSATLNLVDMAFQDTARKNVANWAAQVPKSNQGASSAFDVTSANILDSLRGLVIREFDMIRIMAYSAVSRDKAGVPNGQNLDLGSRINWFSTADLTLDPYYAMTPEFTGVVTSVNRSVSVGGVPAMSVSCLGISRVFTQSVVTANQAIANVFSSPAGAPEISNVLGRMNTLGNTFQGKTSEAVFQDIVGTYLHPKYVKDTVIGSDGTESPKQTLGIPSLDQSYWDGLMGPNPEDPDPTALRFIPFLPMAVLYHILKALRAEPIVVMDDYLDGQVYYVGDSPTRTPSTYLTTLTPYLSMVRTSYGIFDASYMSPQDVFSEIRNSTYYEVFEDRTGAMHMRFPRYNSCLVKQVCNPDNTMMASWSKDDSANFNVTLSQNMLAYVGKVPGIAGRPYLDRLSIIKSGFRVPTIAENPNAVDATFSSALSRFIRDYNSAKGSRKAVIKRLLDLTVNVGQQVIFELGPTDKISGGDLTLISGEDDIFVGYVTNISETMSVSGQNEQTLSLSFVRPVFGTSTQSISDIFAYGIYDLANTVTVPAFIPNGGKVNTFQPGKNQSAIISAMSDIATAYEQGAVLSSSAPYISVQSVSAGKNGWIFATFRDVADPTSLAKLAAPTSVSTLTAAAKPGTKPVTTPQDIKAKIASLNQAASDRASILARDVVKSQIYQSVLDKINAGSPVTTPGGIQNVFLGSSFPKAPSDIHQSGVIYRGYVASASNAAFFNKASSNFDILATTLFGFSPASSTTTPINGGLVPVVLTFPNDSASPRTVSVNNGSLGVSPLGIMKEGLYVLEADAQDRTIAIYQKLIDPGQPVGYSFQKQDVGNAVDVFQSIRNEILPALIDGYSKESAQQDEVMQGILMQIKNLSAILNNPTLTKTAPAGSQQNDSSGYAVNTKVTPVTATGVPQNPIENVGTATAGATNPSLPM